VVTFIAASDASSFAMAAKCVTSGLWSSMSWDAQYTTARAAELFGASPAAAQATANYALVHMYPLLPDEYRQGGCGNGGPRDLRPTDPNWP